MDRLERAALLTELVDEMKAAGSWAGETHVQKAAYVLQVLFGVPSGFNFILYKHGPFSFDLRDELTSMQADGLIEQRPSPPYGPMLVATESSRTLRQSYRALMDPIKASLHAVATRLGPLDIYRLEQAATAVYVLVTDTVSDEEAAAKLMELKPHVAPDGAAWAVREARELITVAHGAGMAAEPA
jgi:uncharacterized protein YwgA